MRRSRSLCGLCVSLLGAVLSAPAAAQDAEGTSDHPVVARYKAATIRAQKRQDFDEYVAPIGPVEKKKEARVEGKVTKTFYEAPAGTSTLAVSRSYQDALKSSGFEILYQCSPKQCHEDGVDVRQRSAGLIYGDYLKAWFPAEEVTHLFTARRTKDDIYVVVTAFTPYGHAEFTYFEVDVVEVKPLEGGLVTVKSAEAMNTDIGSAGHSAVYGVFFDTDKAVVRPESAPTLSEIVKLLSENPTMKLHVVGHTDNTGAFAHNMTLSRQRADAVVAELVGKYKVAAARLDAAGVGSLSPVTTNRTEEGRAKNRRVELVEQ